ncbi:hypothetical protein GCM10007972_22460 [Iodidimonas muriae]|uniref:Uncharacterized protein n=2 Tax=Iodidimonas muriae TaxID=261467 RepID=A0ABQ2LG21_9PROT|nr:hypothetical protein JCM17843_20390 [Kordiimonadales bacterium JCM 17843]GGO14896.1 hypothetical protein GCM10007972_22460 [Iodidimonas muriae]
MHEADMPTDPLHNRLTRVRDALETLSHEEREHMVRLAERAGMLSEMRDNGTLGEERIEDLLARFHPMASARL